MCINFIVRSSMFDIQNSPGAPPPLYWILIQQEHIERGHAQDDDGGILSQHLEALVSPSAQNASFTST
jgi:hypothetical protein